ncbi:hypothetical protein KSS87_018521, partial [Heliosperma pusillum]
KHTTKMSTLHSPHFAASSSSSSTYHYPSSSSSLDPRHGILKISSFSKRLSHKLSSKQQFRPPISYSNTMQQGAVATKVTPVESEVSVGKKTLKEDKILSGSGLISSKEANDLSEIDHFTIFGYARSKMTDEELRNMVSKTLTCRIDKRENCGEKMDEFLKRCFYHSGQYDSQENFTELDKKLKQHEPYRWDHLRYWELNNVAFLIDHYLGKELVENLSVLRFSNLIFEPLWSRQYIRNVQLIFSEDFGTEGRGGYFDNYGIIRDIMQNHLLQILALFAMETPVSLDAEDIRNEKVKVLRSMRPLELDDVVIGQYKSHTRGGVSYPAYTDDATVPKGSLTPTFAAAALFIDNARWDGVPFLMKAGKALHTRSAEIRVQFRRVPGNLYKRNFGTDLDQATNELVIRVQPDEAIYLKINNKVPGLNMRLDRSTLNLHYADRYAKEIPDAYERLLLDAIEGERRLFIRSDELDAAWSLFTPLLKELEDKKTNPEYYPYGSRGPVGAHYLAARYNVKWGDLGLEQ